MTSDLNKIIKSIISPIITCYQKNAPPDAVFPYAIFNIYSVDYVDGDRKDVEIEIDLWDRGTSGAIDNKADELAGTFNKLNNPTNTILPTFFVERGISITEPDKDDKHIRLTVSAQTYVR